VNGFLSYSHDDHEALEAFRPHLAALNRAYGAIVWTDHRIHTGSVWTQKIDDAIKAADIVILLISENFIASDYVWNVELPAIKARHQAGALILPVVLVKCFWQGVIPHIDAAPKENGRLRPVLDWRPQRDGFNRAREQMMAAIGAHFSLAPAPAALS
jgi:hypothetical protein